MLFFQGDIETARAAFDQKIDTNRCPAEAVRSIGCGIALLPRDVDLHVFYRSMAHADFSLGIARMRCRGPARQSGTRRPTPAYAFLAASAAMAGDLATAAHAIETFRRLQRRYDSAAAFRKSTMPGEALMVDFTPWFWKALVMADL